MLPAEVVRHQFTAEEYHRMAEFGVLNEDDRVELIGGEIVEMTPIGWRHVECINRLNRLLVEFAGDRYTVSVQNPIALGQRDEPQPDLALLRQRQRTSLPTTEDVILLAEVADTSVRYDRRVKLPLYARFAVPEVWIVDLVEQKIEVHSEPSAERYLAVQEVGRNEELRSATVESLFLHVREILVQDERV